VNLVAAVWTTPSVTNETKGASREAEAAVDNVLIAHDIVAEIAMTVETRTTTKTGTRRRTVGILAEIGTTMIGLDAAVEIMTTEDAVIVAIETIIADETVGIGMTDGVEMTEIEIIVVTALERDLVTGAAADLHVVTATEILNENDHVFVRLLAHGISKLRRNVSKRLSSSESLKRKPISLLKQKQGQRDCHFPGGRNLDAKLVLTDL